MVTLVILGHWKNQKKIKNKKTRFCPSKMNEIGGLIDNLRCFGPFNSILVTLSQWKDDIEKSLCSGTVFTIERIPPQ